MATRSAAPRDRPLYLIHGTDGFRVRLRAHDLAGALVHDRAPAADLATVPRDGIAEASLALTRVSARDASPDELLLASASEGLFAMVEERRVLLIDDAEAIDPASLAAIPTDAAVVLRANASAGALAKVVRDLGGAVEALDALDAQALEEWTRRRARSRGLELDAASVSALATAVGSDLERLDQELDKLAAYALGGAITARDIRLLVAGAVEEDVFDLTRAVVRRDVKTAIDALERLLGSGEPPLRLHGLLVWQFRLLLVAAGIRTDEDLDRAVSRTGLSRGALSRMRREAAGVRPSMIRHAYESLYFADLAMKTSVDARSVFQLLVLDLCGVPGADLEPLAERPPS